MSKMAVIMLNGKQGAGKTSTAKALMETLSAEYGDKVVYNRFAAVLYEMHAAVHKVFMEYAFKERPIVVLARMHDEIRKVVRNYIWDAGTGYDPIDTDYFLLNLLDEHFADKWLAYDMTKIDGPLLQKLGTEWGREKIDTNVWVICIQSWLKDQARLGKELVLIDDMRFPNEFHAFDQWGTAFKVRLDAPEEERKKRAEKWRDNTQHASEIALDEYAAQGKFDLYVDTHMNDKPKSVELIVAGFTQWKKSSSTSSA